MYNSPDMYHTGKTCARCGGYQYIVIYEPCAQGCTNCTTKSMCPQNAVLPCPVCNPADKNKVVARAKGIKTMYRLDRYVCPIHGWEATVRVDVPVCALCLEEGIS